MTVPAASSKMAVKLKHAQEAEVKPQPGLRRPQCPVPERRSCCAGCSSRFDATVETFAMSDCDSSDQTQRIRERSHLQEGCEGSDDGDKMLKRKEKNRVAAQKSRKRQTQRADLLHEACELLEQRNRKLKREVDSLSEEYHLLTEALRVHEPFCPIMHCSFASSSSILQPEAMAAR